MSVEKRMRLNNIVSLVMAEWIRQEIFHLSGSGVQKACDDSIECVVSQKIDWRRDYLNALHLAANFRSLNDYLAAITAREKMLTKERSATKEVLLQVAGATVEKDFSDAVGELMHPFSLINQIEDLKDLAYVYTCLSGEAAAFPYDNESKYEGKPNPGGMLADKMIAIFATMKEMKLWQEWKGLIENQSDQAAIKRNASLKHLHPI